MIWLISLIILSLVPSIAVSEDCKFNWQPVTTYTNGAPITTQVVYELFYQKDNTTAPVVITSTTDTKASHPCDAGSFWAVATTVNAVDSNKSNVVVLKQVSAIVTFTWDASIDDAKVSISKNSKSRKGK